HSERRDRHSHGGRAPNSPFPPGHTNNRPPRRSPPPGPFKLGISARGSKGLGSAVWDAGADFVVPGGVGGEVCDRKCGRRGRRDEHWL
ncbi:hypothetical protein HK102_011823, partial [Quaeritorhiza haematococci]